MIVCCLRFAEAVDIIDSCYSFLFLSPLFSNIKYSLYLGYATFFFFCLYGLRFDDTDFLFYCRVRHLFQFFFCSIHGSPFAAPRRPTKVVLCVFLAMSVKRNWQKRKKKKRKKRKREKKPYLVSALLCLLPLGGNYEQPAAAFNALMIWLLLLLLFC